MQKRKLGRGGLEVSAIGFGAMGMSQSYGPPGPREEMIAVLRKAVERGVAFSTPPRFRGGGHNEELVGEALAPFKGRVVIATKFGFTLIAMSDPTKDGRPRGSGRRPRISR
jgi:aryl-alcohol dehydrogenase-like predicted oxidoreductase